MNALEWLPKWVIVELIILYWLGFCDQSPPFAFTSQCIKTNMAKGCTHKMMKTF